MKNILSFIILLLLITSCKQTTEQEKDVVKKNETTEISFFTKDSLKIYGDLFEIDKKIIKIKSILLHLNIR